MRNLLILIVVTATMCVTTQAFAETVPDGPRLTPEQFVILPWGETPGDPNALQTVFDCGFNLAGFVRPEFLDLVSAAQLKCIVIDKDQHACDAKGGQETEEQIRAHVEWLAQRTGKHPAVFGYYITDEPGTQYNQQMQLWVDAYRKLVPQATCYINLFGDHATPRQMGAPTYAEYVESFIQTVRPSFLSYDHYSLMADGSIREGYFRNLEAIRALAIKNDLPFWHIVLGNAHYKYAEPSDAGLRFQLYTSLAYGAKGISYFTYYTPNIGNYRLGPIDQYGHKTRTWDMVRNVNMQLHRIGPVYVKLRSLGVFHYPKLPEGSAGVDASKWIESIDGGNLLVGEFESPDGRPFAMVVNKSLRDSIELTINFREPGKVLFVSPYTGQLTEWAPDDNWLAPGQGLLLSVAKDETASPLVSNTAPR